MNWKQQEMAQQMLGEWAITHEIPKVVKTFRRYLGEYAPEQVASLNEASGRTVAGVTRRKSVMTQIAGLASVTVVKLLSWRQTAPGLRRVVGSGL